MEMSVIPPSEIEQSVDTPVTLMKNRDPLFQSGYRRFMDTGITKKKLGTAYNVSMDHMFELGDIVYGNKNILSLYNKDDVNGDQIPIFPNGHYYGMVLDAVSSEPKKRRQSNENTYLVVFMFDCLGEQSCFPFLKSQKCKRIVEGYLSSKIALLRFDEVIGVSTDIWLHVSKRPSRLNIRQLYEISDKVNDNDLRNGVFLFTYCIVPDNFRMGEKYLDDKLAYLVPAPSFNEYIEILTFDVHECDSPFILNIKHSVYDKHIIKNVRRNRNTKNICLRSWNLIYGFCVWTLSKLKAEVLAGTLTMPDGREILGYEFDDFMFSDAVKSMKLTITNQIQEMGEYDVSKMDNLMRVILNVLYGLYVHKLPLEYYFIWFRKLKQDTNCISDGIVPRYFTDVTTVDKVIVNQDVVGFSDKLDINGRSYTFGGVDTFAFSYTSNPPLVSEDKEDSVNGDDGDDGSDVGSFIVPDSDEEEEAEGVDTSSSSSSSPLPGTAPEPSLTLRVTTVDTEMRIGDADVEAVDGGASLGDIKSVKETTEERVKESVLPLSEEEVRTEEEEGEEEEEEEVEDSIGSDECSSSSEDEIEMSIEDDSDDNRYFTGSSDEDDEDGDCDDEIDEDDPEEPCRKKIKTTP